MHVNYISILKKEPHSDGGEGTPRSRRKACCSPERERPGDFRRPSSLQGEPSAPLLEVWGEAIPGSQRRGHIVVARCLITRALRASGSELPDRVLAGISLAGPRDTHYLYNPGTSQLDWGKTGFPIGDDLEGARVVSILLRLADEVVPNSDTMLLSPPVYFLPVLLFSYILHIRRKIGFW